jgi:hypothetical protein
VTTAKGAEALERILGVAVAGLGTPATTPISVKGGALVEEPERPVEGKVG